MTQSGPVTGPAADGTDEAGGVDGVIARMRALQEELPPHDGVAAFNRVYLAVMLSVRRSLLDGLLPRPRSAAALAAVFAGRYPAAVDLAAAGEPVPACWRPLFRARHHTGVHPVQFALAGVNAHIGYDLALAVVDTARTHGCEPSALQGAFDRIGDVLVELEERIREDLVPGPDPLDVADPLTHLIAGWNMERARDAAWSAARLLWSMRRLPELAEEFTHRLDTGVGLVGRFLLTPLEHRPVARTL
ncbi:DUF5995 family protein [Streptomyces radiopugnans]|uniref:Uncharacterized protein n=1 Tax=Streptomyces radiopugnans TaxID=403935 RepID=A0A1H9BNS4_9ACTN|nr:DUF5995 family protein [Streptomyces radiopugnans]SEP90644.1 hypothetical protein SAMN05216481_102504 [Streptomyces radiopugnans]